MDEVNKAFRIRKTILEMLVDRGYLVSQAEQELTLESFKERHLLEDGSISRESLLLAKRKKDDPTDQIFVFFPEDAKVGVNVVKKYFETMADEQVYQAIVVVQDAMTSFAKQAVARVAPKFMIEVFYEKELLINITKHVLVPPHVVLSKEEKAALLQRYRLKESQLPRMQVADPVARYYGLRLGQVVKIIRASETAGRYVTYRLVL